MKNKFSILTAGLLTAMAFNSCKDKAEDPKKNEESELITKIHLHLSKITPTDTIELPKHPEWFDLTPDDPAGRTIDTIKLEPNTQYLGEIMLSDNSKTPAVDITEEVAEEKDDHLFVYKANADTLVIDRTDQDSKGKQVGLKFKLTTKLLTGKSRLNVILKHQPGIKDGTEGPGDADFDVWFPVEIK